MSAELWHAILNPRGPNYERLKAIFPENRVPLQSPGSIKADLGAEKEVEVYMLNLSALPLKQRARLMFMVAQNSGVSVAVVEEVACEQGFPIRAADVIVSFDLRAFV
ncbi:MAG TPA: hypothetical protein VGT04_10625 [Acidobacteriaceae bacterium]|nr:hypothetical protein [Acidobacteriaceae bacterium]